MMVTPPDGLGGAEEKCLTRWRVRRTIMQAGGGPRSGALPVLGSPRGVLFGHSTALAAL